ncbi:MAG: MarR family transcriptional regulator [Caldilineaceae bacterium]
MCIDWRATHSPRRSPLGASTEFDTRASIPYNSNSSTSNYSIHSITATLSPIPNRQYPITQYPFPMPTHFDGSPTECLALDSFIKLVRAADSVSSRVNEHLRDFGLTVSQFGVLEALHHLGVLNQSDLAQKLLKSTGNLTTVVDNLAKQGLVERRRCTEDRRVVYIHLTDAGREMIESILPSHVTGVVDVFSVLSPDEQQTLGGLLRQLGKGE